MLRRRKKSAPREDRAPAPRGAAAPPTPGSRRRPKPGAHVPPELRVPADVVERLVRPAREKAPAAKQPAAAPPAKQPVVLVTGFEPFGGEATNPSWDICEALPKSIGTARIETCRVPCEFGRAVAVVGQAIHRLRPAIVLSLGQAGGRSVIGVERVAINVDDARLPDNAGHQPIDKPIVRDGPAALFATIPVKAMVAAMREAGAPAEVSNSAGTYVCNHLMYGVLHHVAAHSPGTRAGFVHVPYSPAQVAGKAPVASMAVATMVAAITAAIGAALRGTEVHTAEGTLD